MSRLNPVRTNPGQAPRPPLPGPQMPPPPSTTQVTQQTGGFQTRPAGDRGSFATGGGSGNTNVQAVMPDMSQFQPFQDAVFQEYERTTQPELERRRARMNQDLVNRGITPGSEAYDREMTRFMQMENDAFSGAQRSALAQALQAQGQFFDQGLGQAQINAGLQQARLAADTSRYGTDQGRAGALERALLGDATTRRGQDLQGLLGLGGLQNDRYGLDNQRLGLNQTHQRGMIGLDQSQQGIDLGALNQLFGMYTGAAGFNNNALNQDYGRAFGTFGQFQPQAPIIPINAGGAFGTALQGSLGQAGMQQQQNDAMWSGIGSLGAAALPLMFSDRNAKTDFEAVDNDEVLESLRKTPVSRWKYKGDNREHIGPMAQDFGANITNEPEARVIYPVDAVGALIASVQAVADKLDSVTQRLEALEA